jgi:hypothetical protein
VVADFAVEQPRCRRVETCCETDTPSVSLAAAFGTAAVAVTGGALTVIAMLLPLLLPALRRIEIVKNSKAD